MAGIGDYAPTGIIWPTWATTGTNYTIRWPNIANIEPFSAEQEGELDAMKEAMIVSKIDALERRIAELEEKHRGDQ